MPPASPARAGRGSGGARPWAPLAPLAPPGVPQPLPPLRKIKCVLLGDGAVGKTSLIISYTTNGYPQEYVPTAIDTYDAIVTVDGEPVTLEMCDTPGQDDFDTLRPLAYPHTDVFLLCFSVVCPSSFVNIREKWVPELKRTHAQGRMPPVILIGTQSDLRENATTMAELARQKAAPVSEAAAQKLAGHIGFERYLESSALTQKNLKEVFDAAILAGLGGQRRQERRAAQKQRRREKRCLGRGGCLLM
eukprot:snap_masked-scaffold1063_size65393-processed-gene-0.9 protein:Tk02167 transcript:snap_masked-scaffold1063_size65393-processed-gene-0.9-mRNA-1 annotation:"rho-related gtp-binding protein"